MQKDNELYFFLKLKYRSDVPSEYKMLILQDLCNNVSISATQDVETKFFGIVRFPVIGK